MKVNTDRIFFIQNLNFYAVHVHDFTESETKREVNHQPCASSESIPYR